MKSQRLRDYVDNVGEVAAAMALSLPYASLVTRLKSGKDWRVINDGKDLRCAMFDTVSDDDAVTASSSIVLAGLITSALISNSAKRKEVSLNDFVLVFGLDRASTALRRLYETIQSRCKDKNNWVVMNVSESDDGIDLRCVKIDAA